jgi:hypothetical protein
MGSFFLIFIILTIVIMLIAPIIFQLNVYFDTSSSKIGCSIMIYNKIKVLGGYFSACPGGFAFHTSDRKAMLFTYQQTEAARKRLSKSNIVKVRSINVITETAPEYLVGISIIENIVKGYILFYEGARNNRAMIKTKILLKGEDVLRVFLKISFQATIIQQIFYWMQYLFRRLMKNGGR